MPAYRPPPSPDGATREGHPEELRPETVDEARLADLLVRLVGGHLLANLDLGDPAHAPYLQWAAAEARAQLTPAERAQLAVEAEQFATRMRADFEAREAERAAEVARTTPSAAREVRGRAARKGTPRPRRRTPIPVDCMAAAPDDVPVRESGAAASIRDAMAAAARAAATPYLDLAVCAGVGRELWDEPCERWLALPPGVPPGEHVALPVRGDSMQPLLHDGDTLLVRVGSACVPGDVVVARQPDDGYVVKRVGACGREGLRLVAENARYPDVLLPDDPSLVVGVVVLRWCPHGGTRVT